jgi:hypothetical protein
MNIIMALLAFIPSPTTCSTPELATYYQAGRNAGSAYVTAVVHRPVDCGILAEQGDDLVLRGEHELALATRAQGNPPRSCVYYGSGEAILEAVDAAMVECGGSRDQ